MPIFKKKSDRNLKGSRARERERNARNDEDIAAAGSSNRGGSGADQQNTMQQQQQQQQPNLDQDGRSQAETAGVAAHLQMLNQQQQRQQQQMSASAQTRNEDISSMGNISYVPVASGMQQVPYVHQPSPGHLSQLSPSVPAGQQQLGANVSPVHIGQAAGNNMPPSPMLMPMHGYGHPLQPQPQNTSPLHVAVGPTMVPALGMQQQLGRSPPASPRGDNYDEWSGFDDTDVTETTDDDEEEMSLPTVTEAAEDVWRNDADDFVGVAESLRTLHQSILATAEEEEEEEEEEEVGEGRRPQDDEFDTAETFLSIQGAALRYHARWEGRLEERQRLQAERDERRRVRAEKKAGKAAEMESKADSEEKEMSIGAGTSEIPEEESISATQNEDNNKDQGPSSEEAGTPKEAEREDSEENDAEKHAAEVGATAVKDEPIKSNPNLEEDEVEEDATVSTESSISRSDSAQWEEDEQAAWDVWEEAIGAAAALATVCVGPAWHSQIRRRRQWLVNGRTDLLPRRSNSLMSDQDDGMSVSTVGMGSVAGAAWQAQQEQANNLAQLGQNFRQQLGGTPELEEVTHTSLGSNPQAGGRINAQERAQTVTPGFEPWDHPIIPEVLPAAMLRFASSASEMALPPLRARNSPITLTERGRRASRAVADEDESTESTPFADAVGRAIWEEQRWLVRRQRVGNAQRDLVLSLCCDTSDSVDNSTQAGSSIARRSQTGSASNSNRNIDRDGPQWTIAGAHVPVASMLVSWVETAKAGWPTQKQEFDPHSLVSSVGIVAEKGATVDDPDGKGTDAITSELVPSISAADLVWSQIAKAGAIDWWYTLQVSRAATDLVSAGWRPPPRGKTGENCVEGLLEISRRGLLLSSRDLKSLRRATDQDAREERLAAASSAAEALSALANIGSRGYLPMPTVSVVARNLCSLLASVDSTMSHVSTSSLYPLAPTNNQEEEAELRLEKETFLSQRESCVADIAELLWSLLAHQSSACIAVTALLEFIEGELFSVPASTFGLGGTTASSSSAASYKSAGSRRGDKKSVLAAAGAIRACGAAFWGDPPQVKGVYSLRIFWNKLLETLSEISSTIHCPREFHAINGSDASPLEDIKDDDAKPTIKNISTDTRCGPEVKQTLCLCEQTPPSLVVMLEVAVALRRLADGEFIRRIDTLAPDEWDPFLNALENLVPWLDCKLNLDHPAKCPLAPKRSKFLFRRIIFEVRAIFDQTELFLTRGDIDRTFHCIVDDEYRKKLHTLMLRTACPLLQPSHATNVATSVVRSWTWGGYYLNRGDIWYKIASQVLGDAFSLYDSESFGYRGYVHAPSVRLTALLAITQRYGETIDSRKESQTTPTRGRKKNVTNYTPAALATKVNEMQVERLCSFFLPYLHEVLLPNNFSDLLKKRARVVLPVPSSQKIFASHQIEPAEAPSEEAFALVEKTIVDEFRLRRSAVRILGRLFRILTSERSVRSSIICTLRNVARSVCSFSIAVFPILQEQSELFQKDDARMLVSKELLSVSLKAVRQLEDCLATPFGARPLTHWCVGEIMEALCTVVKDVSLCRQVEGNYLLIDAASRKLLALAALLPLARIRISHDARALLIKQADGAAIVDEKIMDIINNEKEEVAKKDQERDSVCATTPCIDFDEYEQNQGLLSETAPFVFIGLSRDEPAKDGKSPDQGPSRTRTGTTFSLDAVLLSMHQLLDPKDEQPTELMSSLSLVNVSAVEVDASIEALCYNTFHELMLCGLPIPLKIITKDKEEKEESEPAAAKEVEARSHAIASFACHVGYAFDSQDDSSSIDAVAQALVKLLKSTNPTEVQNGCRGTLALLASALSTTTSLDIQDAAPSSHVATQESEKGAWAHDLCNQLIDRLHSFVDAKTSPVFAQDPAVPLLSTIYDVFTLSRTSIQCPPAAVRLRTVAVCLRLCSSQICNWISSQGKVLALQCAGSAVRVMKDNEAEVALNESMWDIHPSESSDVYEALIIDLLVRRYLASKQVDGTSNAKDDRDVQFIAKLTSHEALAKETEDIEIFPVERDRRATAAWLCGDTLLMCRMGDSKSRHRGWIEVSLRSPTCRLRHLVRLPLCNNITDPDFPSSLWSLTRSLNKPAEIVPFTTHASFTSGTLNDSSNDAVEEESASGEGLSSPYHKTKSTALIEAEAMMQRFNTFPNIVGPNFVLPRFDPEEEIAEEQEQEALDDLLEKPSANSNTKTTERKEDVSENASNDIAIAAKEKNEIESGRDELKAMIAMRDNMIVTGCIQDDERKRPHHNRSLSADNLSATNILLSKDELASTSKTMSAHSWLKSVLGRSKKNIERVEDELRVLGFPELLIGSDPGQDPARRRAPGEPVVVRRVFEHVQRLQSGPKLDRAVGLLDRTACSLQTHKIALLFAGPGSTNPTDSSTDTRSKDAAEENILLRATQGSPEFIHFSRGLGDMVITRHLKYFSGGLDTSTYLADGTFALAWVGDDDDCRCDDGSVTAKTMVLFHSVPLMPPGTNNRKRHVGNDVVHIIFFEKDDAAVNGFGRLGNNVNYEDSNDQDAILSGEFGFITIIVSQSAAADLTRVTVRARDNLDDETSAAVSHLLGTTLFPKDIAPKCVRQLAVRADIACRSTKSMQDRLGLVSNWEERLHQIRKLGRHALES